MGMAKIQSTLPKLWSHTSPKKARLEDETSSPLSLPESDDEGQASTSYAGLSTANIFTTQQEKSSVNQSQDESLFGPSCCTALCCYVDIHNAYQPTDKKTLSSLTNRGRNFQPHWFKRFPWLSVCKTDKKVYCICCRYATHGLISFSKMGEKCSWKLVSRIEKRQLRSFQLIMGHKYTERPI